MIKKVITAHNGARDQYELSKAFNENNILHKLVTDFYVPQNPVTNLLKSNRSSSIPLSRIKISNSSTLELVKRKLNLNYSFEKSDRGITNTVISLIKHTQNLNLFLYSHYAFGAFEYIDYNKLNISKNLFQLHPHPKSIIEILEPEFDRLPFAAESLKLESEFSLSSNYLDNLSSEVLLSNNCFVASSFTKKTLVDNGGDPQKIHIIPYGVDSFKFPPKNIISNKSRFLNIIFVGSVVQRKGIADLFEALRLVNSNFINLTIVGRTFVDQSILEQYRSLNFNLHIDISNRNLSKLLQQSDVLILPSLAEGFGHVILEAMASGTTVITTENTCGPDIIDNQNDGFIIPIKCPYQIAETINYLAINRDICTEMGKLAYLKSKKFQWIDFRKKIIHYYSELTQK